MNLLLPFGCALILAGCSKSSKRVDIEELTIAPYKVPCVGEMVQLCRLEKSSTDSEWKLAYDEIIGFEAKWGHSYQVIVEVESIENPFYDGSSLKRRLVIVRGEQEDQIGTEYRLRQVPLVEPALGISKQGYTFYGDIISCLSTKMCAELFSAKSEGASGTSGHVEIVLSYTGDYSGLPLEIVDWSYSDQELAYQDTHCRS